MILRHGRGEVYQPGIDSDLRGHRPGAAGGGCRGAIRRLSAGGGGRQISGRWPGRPDGHAPAELPATAAAVRLPHRRAADFRAPACGPGDDGAARQRCGSRAPVRLDSAVSAGARRMRCLAVAVRCAEQQCGVRRLHGGAARPRRLRRGAARRLPLVRPGPPGTLHGSHRRRSPVLARPVPLRTAAERVGGGHLGGAGRLACGCADRQPLPGAGERPALCRLQRFQRLSADRIQDLGPAP